MTRNRAGSAALPGSAVLRRNRGFTLVEAMVALIVLSVGLLGIAALYVETLRANRTSLYRTQAVNLATNIGDRMRSNRNPASAYACGSPCDPAAGSNAIAIADLTDWVNQIEQQLPGGTADVHLYRTHGDDACGIRRRRRLGRAWPGRSSDLPAPDRDLRTPP